jgi:hypothetical protein
MKNIQIVYKVNQIVEKVEILPQVVKMSFTKDSVEFWTNKFSLKSFRLTDLKEIQFLENNNFSTTQEGLYH